MSHGGEQQPDLAEASAVLGRFAAGEEAAGERLFELLIVELRGLADRAMRGQPRDHTLSATALVNEAWMRIASANDTAPQGRRHFLAVAAKAMRSVLVDHARRTKSLKRGGEFVACGLTDELVDAYSQRAGDLVELDDALDRLAVDEPRAARVVELRFFAGLTIAETAQVLGLGTATVEREWRLARIWLREELG